MSQDYFCSKCEAYIMGQEEARHGIDTWGEKRTHKEHAAIEDYGICVECLDAAVEVLMHGGLRDDCL